MGKCRKPRVLAIVYKITKRIQNYMLQTQVFMLFPLKGNRRDSALEKGEGNTQRQSPDIQGVLHTQGLFSLDHIVFVIYFTCPINFL